MLFYIESNVTIRVAGISGPFLRNQAYLVNAPNLVTAKGKYENQVRLDCAHMVPASVVFEYTKIASEIK
jgi:hypothetical protein